MYSGYWDDYYDIKENRKDCIHTLYKVVDKTGKTVLEGRHALKQCCSRLLGIPKRETKGKSKVPIVQAAGYTVYSRKWNETHKRTDSEWKKLTIV